ncbi:YaiI/YqxD family protein [Alcanivorax sp. DP30]|uniref:YaiI/YqxD family protein n=1 Tax=Alcanivorax sp. DP30 TaxID=2606217 RepID=UPI00136EA7C3|nr:YaiI/YqxD family protein [Alcanivorax sp. DP30]MZR62865.1 YaiI/YqxD family protein [Alcanivorax sp. DP30]
MHIWVDADACPRPVKEVLVKAAQRVQVPCTFVANQPIAVPRSALIRSIQVGQGFDVADNEIVQRCAAGDLVVTQDIPLAAEVVAKGCEAVTPRGHWLDKDTVRERLNMRDFMEEMRSAGMETGGPKSFSPQDKGRFANAIDRWLARQK